ncbi:MAG TPA: class I SAM-dependent methyltransferase [Allosphingosinicella sp.]|nr:class I SAM-dependent methyltransferase [Allosphingosinicella sp.]
MNILKRVGRALGRTLSPSVTVAKDSARARDLSALLSGRLTLDPGIKSVVDQVRARAAADTTPYPPEAYGGYATIGEHAAAASSRDPKLALLEALVRRRAAGSILEIGTAYGLSAVTMALAQGSPNVVTIDFFEPQASVGPKNIASVTGGVQCIKERKEEALPRLHREGRKFDLVFHDGGHTGDGYVQDFDTIHPMLTPQSIYIIDDIAWDEGERRGFTSDKSRRTCREGWEELLRDPRVEGAVVANRSVGILLTR